MKRLLPLRLFLLSPILFTWVHGERIYPEQESFPLNPEAVTAVEIDETAIVTTIHVDPQHPAASDSNSGLTPESPKRTLRNAVDSALSHMEQFNEGVRILLADGVHESPKQTTARQLNTERTQTLPLIIEGENRGGVIIDCTRLIDPSEIQNLGNGLYGFAWTEDWGLSRYPWMNGPFSAGSFGELIGHRAENLFINGQRLDPVVLEAYSAELLDLYDVRWTYNSEAYLGREAVRRAGSYGVSEIEENMIFFRPPQGVDMSTAEVRASELGSVIDFRRKSNLVIRNLMIFGCGQFHHNSVIRLWGDDDPRSTNVLVEDVEIYSTASGDGISISNVNNVTMRRMIIRDCGGNGYGGTRNRNMLLEDLDFSENNWRSRMAGMSRGTVAGLKLLQSDDVLTNRYIAYANGASGFWFDSEVANATTNELYSVGNYMFGFYNEKNWGKQLIKNSVFMNNENYGVYFAENGHTTLEDSIIFHNGVAAIGVRTLDSWRGAPILFITQDNVIRNNLIVSRFPEGISIYKQDGTVAGKQLYLDSFVATFNGDHNQYWAPIFTKVFSAQSGVDLAGWKAAIPAGQEANSVFSDPGIDNTGDGIAHFFLYESFDGQSVTDLDNWPSFSRFDWDYSNRRPVVEIPYNWRKGAAYEAHFQLFVPESGVYRFVLHSNMDSALYISPSDKLEALPQEPDYRSGLVEIFRDWQDAGNGTVELTLDKGGFHHIAIRAVAPVDAGKQPFLTLGWHAPWMEQGSIVPLAAPYIRSPVELPSPARAFFETAARTIKGSFTLGSLGSFWQFEANWTYQQLHEFLYIPTASNPDRFWAYSPDLGWIYTGRAFGQSWIWSHLHASWVYAAGRTGSGRLYYIYTGPDQGWVLLP